MQIFLERRFCFSFVIMEESWALGEKKRQTSQKAVKGFQLSVFVFTTLQKFYIQCLL